MPLILLSFAAGLSISAEASACFFGSPYGAGEQPTEREIASQRQQHSRVLVRQRFAQARSALAQGNDTANELAKMLIPNIRPIPIQHSDCGPTNEIDFGDGEETVEGWLSGTRLAGRGLGDEFAMLIRTYRGETFGRACNAEFRSRFAAYLRLRLSPHQLRESYLFLAARWREGDGDIFPFRRLVSFDGRTRQPPLRWRAEDQWQEAQLRHWTLRSQIGRALQRSVDEFWREVGPTLSHSDRACPAALARWPASQEHIVVLIEERLARIERRRTEAEAGRVRQQ